MRSPRQAYLVVLSLAIFSPVAASVAAGVAKAAPSPENSVVKIFSTVRYPDVSRPWTRQAPVEVSGSGVVIEGRRILTNAHVVLYAGQIQVQANQAGDKISASVEAIAPGIDLAVLKLDDDGFFDTHAPMARAAALPRIKDAVMAYGFPQGALRCPSPRASCRASSSCTTTFPCRGCVSRSMPPSIPATAAVRRWPATR